MSMPRRRKNNKPKYDGYVAIPRSFLLLLKEGIIDLTDFGGLIAELLGATFDMTEDEYRYRLSDGKMAKKAGLSRSLWTRRRQALERAGLMQIKPQEDDAGSKYDYGQFPIWTDWYTNFNGGEYLHRRDERLHDLAADQNRRSAKKHINLDAMVAKNEKINGSTRREKSKDGANMHHQEKYTEPIKEVFKRTPSNNPSFAAKKQQMRSSSQGNIKEQCQNCGQRVNQTQATWSQLKEGKTLCGNCCPNKMFSIT